MKPIRKAVFPVAGLGTRFLPATKAMPKEMLPVVDRPGIQHVVDEARQAGIEHFIFVTGRNKSVIEDHFDRQDELEMTLRQRQKRNELALLSQDLPGPGTTSFSSQQEPIGLEHRVAGGEIQITDAMIELAKKQPFFGLKFEGESYDCGSKIGFLTANVAYALARPDIAPEFRKEATRLLGKD